MLDFAPEPQGYAITNNIRIKVYRYSPPKELMMPSRRPVMEGHLPAFFESEAEAQKQIDETYTSSAVIAQFRPEAILYMDALRLASTWRDWQVRTRQDGTVDYTIPSLSALIKRKEIKVNPHVATYLKQYARWQQSRQAQAEKRAAADIHG